MFILLENAQHGYKKIVSEVKCYTVDTFDTIRPCRSSDFWNFTLVECSKEHDEIPLASTACLIGVLPYETVMNCAPI